MLSVLEEKKKKKKKAVLYMVSLCKCWITNKKINWLIFRWLWTRDRCIKDNYDNINGFKWSQTMQKEYIYAIDLNL